MTMDQVDRYRRIDKESAVYTILNYNYEPSELGSTTSSEDESVEKPVHPNEEQVLNIGEKNDLHTHHNATKPAEVSQGLTIEGLRILTQETSSQGLTIEGLKRLMQETSDKNDKIKAELFEQADEIEAQVSRMRAMITPGQQENSTPPRPNDAITDSETYTQAERLQKSNQRNISRLKILPSASTRAKKATSFAWYPSPCVCQSL